MGVYLYKDGEQVFVKKSKQASAMLKAGYTPTNEPAKKEVSEEEQTLRQLAKECGIQNWHNKKIENIRAELEELED